MNLEAIRKFVDQSKTWSVRKKNGLLVDKTPFYDWLCFSEYSVEATINDVIDSDFIFKISPDLRKLADIVCYDVKSRRYQNSKRREKSLQMIWEWSNGYKDKLESIAGFDSQHRKMGANAFGPTVELADYKGWGHFWLYLMYEYLSRKAFEYIDFDFDDRVSAIKGALNQQRAEAWGAYARVNHKDAYKFGDVIYKFDYKKAEWDSNGSEQRVSSILRTAASGQVQCNDLSAYDVSDLESVLGKDVVAAYHVLVAADNASLKTQADAAARDFRNFCNVLNQSAMSGAMRQNEMRTELNVGKVKIEIRISDIGRGVAVLEATKAALAVGGTAAAVATVASCPPLIAAIPVASFLWDKFKGKK